MSETRLLHLQISLLEWNRSQLAPPITQGYEYGVATAAYNIAQGYTPVLAAPIIDPLPAGKLISIAAELACRRPLRPLEDVCSRQKSISTPRLLESVEMCGDTLAQIACEIRQAYDEMQATITQQAAELDQYRSRIHE